MLELWCWCAGFYMEICYQENAYQCPYLHHKIAWCGAPCWFVSALLKNTFSQLQLVHVKKHQNWRLVLWNLKSNYCENWFPTTFSSGFNVQAWSPPIGKMQKWLWITCRHMSSCFSFTVRQTFWALEQIIFSHLILGGLRADLWCKENLHNSFKHLALIWWCPSLWMTHSHILLYSTWMDILALYIGSWVGQEKFGTLSLSSGFIECYVEVQLLRPYMPNS